MSMDRKYAFCCMALILILFSVCIYKGSIRNHILDWDDQFYLKENPYIKELSIANLKSIFSAPYFKNYTPIHLVSYLFDRLLWGENYTGYHLTNLFLHIINGILILFLIYSWTKDWWIAFFVYGIFLAHPVNVESVAWLSERKGLLAGLFFLIALLSYDRLKKTGIRVWYIICFIAFCLAVLSKPMAITLPLIIILLDITLYRTRSSIADIIPFFLISFFSFGSTLWAQKVGGGVKSYVGGSLITSVLSIPYIILRYVSILFWPFPPVRQSCRYVTSPERFKPIFSLNILGSMIFVICLLSAIYVWLLYKKDRTGILGITWFFIILLPVLNFIPTSTQMADRYLYIPAIGIYLAVGIWISKGIKKIAINPLSSGTKPLSFLIPVIMIAALGLKTQKRVRVWQSDKTLWEDALFEEPGNYYALTYLANFYFQESLKETDQEQGRAELMKAEGLFRSALEINPDFAQANLGIAGTLIQTGQTQWALPFLKRALKTNTEPLQTVRIFYNLGLVFLHTGKLKEAEHWFNKAIKKDKGFKLAYLGLARLYLKKAEGGGDKNTSYQLAANIYQDMIRLFPNEFEAYFSLAVLRGEEGRADEAIGLYEKALSLPISDTSPFERANAHINLGILYQKQGEYRQALVQYETAVRIAQKHPMAQQIIGVISEIRAALYKMQIEN
ncbi:MAG: tetratricopeptide repeat protein [bacterium]